MTDHSTSQSGFGDEPQLATISNNYPLLTTRIHLTYPFAQLCPVSGEPQPGSTITISYQAGVALLETKALRQYLMSFTGENLYGIRDLEEAAQVIAQHCADLLGTMVHITARYKLQVGEMEVEVSVMPAERACLQDPQTPTIEQPQ